MNNKNFKKKPQNSKKKFTPFVQIQEEKLKTLMPTLRVKKRFIKIKINSKKDLTFEEISSTLSDEVLYFIGAIDYSQSGFWILKDSFNLKEKELIVKTSVKLKDKVICALSLLQDIEVEIKRVSGTLKGVNKRKDNNSNK